MKVSVVVAAYNVERFLPKTIESILTQTYSDIEILLVDDGSTDQSGEICDSYARKDVRCKVIHQQNKGLSGARNTGKKHASGEYISFIDGDDILHPAFIGALVSLLEQEPTCDVAIALGVKVAAEEPIRKYLDAKPDLNDYRVISAEEYINLLMSDSSEQSYQWHVVWNKLYRTEFVQNMEFEKVHNEDLVFNYKMALQCPKIVKMNSVPLYFWIQRGTSISHNSNFYTNIKSIQSYTNILEYTPAQDTCHRSLCLSKLFKRFLSCRSALASQQSDEYQLLQQVRKQYFNEYLHSENSILEKSMLFMMVKCPLLYTLFMNLMEVRAKFRR